ncbi:hypothetical protein [Lysinibacillus fusiformis]|uniref:hypothetical protein n=1 Tax=Lysinibacillus fusiformis TaxID=28031 RepID=UPI000D389CC6|nr:MULTISPECIES: hypothetical protein [Lysinibacillus]MED4669801.1 hypothetical protein [Lysinibacillus fusiformis]QAS55705.1 hypothetical protein LSP_04555 [Lysinibacillus sphaericus]RDV27704.1 hypothetical protein C7B90_19155 [Lysinibacillus fusiformis]GED64065.1 hypothetical protein LFU01_25170 [Lysinibacillus fusiformis]
MELVGVIVTNLVGNGRRSMQKQEVIENVLEIDIESTTNGGKRIFRISDGTERSFYNKDFIN